VTVVQLRDPPARSIVPPRHAVRTIDAAGNYFCLPAAGDIFILFKEMKERSHLSTFELMVMLALARLGDEAYGVPIASEIEAHSGREVVVGSVYAALDRLETRGLAVSALGEPTPERGGRAKRYFRLTARGLREARAAQRTLTGLWRGIPQLGGETT
jgi:DNA-binding PadR family transcriptional regulator